MVGMYWDAIWYDRATCFPRERGLRLRHFEAKEDGRKEGGGREKVSKGSEGDWIRELDVRVYSVYLHLSISSNPESQKEGGREKELTQSFHSSV